MKTKSKKPIIRRMWAACWLSYGSKINPHPSECGAPMLAFNKEKALKYRVNDNQIITRVRVIILKDSTHSNRNKTKSV